jgi:hypothetical protein
MQCEKCGQEFKSARWLQNHMERSHSKDSIFDALKEMRAEIAQQRAELAAEKAAIIQAKEDKIDQKRLEQEAAKRMEQKIVESRKRYEAEKKLDYTAGDDGLDMTVNHYRVTIAPNSVGKIPESFLPILQQRLEIKRKGAMFAAAVNGAAKDKPIEEIGNALRWAMEKI